MARLILKSPYLKSNARQHLVNYVRYIATRSGVVKPMDTGYQLRATGKQQKIIEELLELYPDSAELYECQEYRENKGRRNADQFILRIAELHGELFGSRQQYVNYIATRPRVEKISEHGLFSDKGEDLKLSKVSREISESKGNVWTHILSLRREDAKRLGYDTAEKWMTLLRANRNMIARNMKISPENFRWFAAFHNEGDHPHVHLMAFSINPTEAYLSKNGIRNIKSSLARQIFHQDLINIYQVQTQRRDALRQEGKQIILDAARQGYENPEAEKRFKELSRQLEKTKGKKVYQFLPRESKKLVDQILTIFAEDERIARLYSLWYEQENEVLKTYRKNLPPPVPLPDNKTFAPLKKAVIDAALALDAGSIDDLPEEPEMLEEEPDGILDEREWEQEESEMDEDEPQAPEYIMKWTEMYKTARERWFTSGKDGDKRIQAFELMFTEAEAGNVLAIHDVGKMYLDGIGCTKNEQEAKEWFLKAYHGFRALEETQDYTPYFQYRIGKMHAMGYGVEKDYTNAAKWYKKSVAQGNQYAAYALGCQYLRGQGVEQDNKQAFQLFYMAATHERRPNAYAMYELGCMCKSGKGIEKNQKSAEKWYSMAFEQFLKMEKSMKDDRLQYRLGNMLMMGTGTTQNLETAEKYFLQAAAVENKDALYGLGRLYMNRNFSKMDVQKGVHYYDLAAQQGHGFAQYALGKLYLEGKEVQRNVPAAMDWLERSADQGNAAALCFLGQEYVTGKNVPQDTGRGIYYLESAWNHKNNHAGYLLGKLYLEGRIIQKDEKKAVRLLASAAQQGHDGAQYVLGKAYLHGMGVVQDISMGVLLLRASAKAGNTNAAYVLGSAYLTGTGPPRDKNMAEHYLAQAAAKGHAFAAYRLGKVYLETAETPQDIYRAIQTLNQAAQSGLDCADYALGKLYIKGNILPPNLPAALYHLTRASKSSNPYAQYLLGRTLLLEQVKNVPLATYWLQEAARQNNSYAQLALGKLYFYGRDVTRDKEKAIRYLQASAGQGNPYAVLMLQRIHQNRDFSMALGVMRLFGDITQAIQNQIHDQDQLDMVESRVQSRINQKRMAHGLRQ